MQVYSESSSSLTVQLHSLSRLRMLLLISRLSIFAIVCARDRGEDARKFGSLCGHVNDLRAVWSNTWSQAASVRRSGGGAGASSSPACERADGAEGPDGCASSVRQGSRGKNNATVVSPPLSPVRLHCHPPPHCLLQVSSPLPCRCSDTGRAEAGEWRVCQPKEQ